MKLFVEIVDDSRTDGILTIIKSIRGVQAVQEIAMRQSLRDELITCISQARRDGEWPAEVTA